MGDRNLTLFAFHSHGDVQFGPTSIPAPGSKDESEAESAGKSWFGGGSSKEESEDESIDVPAEDESGGLGGLVVALVVLVGIAMVVKKLKGGDEGTEVEVAESDDL
ncbi:hypothetical protein L593_13450 [Salinarchaeum sp. Harcht-Bsk1]|uniref:hypothetical protein n=1 Tax=Salinarchaeum sp. Harcht-Bsk1 TaxID=1333523 RepID=UPI0003423DA2|nr:hypothetical protein [Salinarchaeum sp. Harcht-Bsk1]AGN02629.1 hypothetical protein L593_13450 [Salinarchaeum sp. Harcht-Bsk1]